jgi:hypothetical protein
LCVLCRPRPLYWANLFSIRAGNSIGFVAFHLYAVLRISDWVRIVVLTAMRQDIPGWPLALSFVRAGLPSVTSSFAPQTLLNPEAAHRDDSQKLSKRIGRTIQCPLAQRLMRNDSQSPQAISRCRHFRSALCGSHSRATKPRAPGSSRSRKERANDHQRGTRSSA